MDEMNVNGNDTPQIDPAPLPDPAAPLESYSGGITPLKPLPGNDPQTDAQEEYSAHYSWNGSNYTETAKPSGYDASSQAVPPQNNGAQNVQGNPMPNYNQANFTQNNVNQANLNPDLESRANTIQTLGILSIIINIIGCGCGCSCIGLILSIVGLVKANGLSTVMHMMSDAAKERVSTGKKCCIAGIIITVLAFLFGILSILLPALIGYMERY